jgi:hypothetical protein
MDLRDVLEADCLDSSCIVRQMWDSVDPQPLPAVCSPSLAGPHGRGRCPI